MSNSLKNSPVKNIQTKEKKKTLQSSPPSTPTKQPKSPTDDDSLSDELTFPLNKKLFYWRKIQATGEIPVERSSFCSALINKTYIIIHGGCDNENDLQDAFTLDLTNFHWKKEYGIQKKIGKPLVGHTACVFEKGHRNDREGVLIFGGWQGDGYSNRSYVFDAKFYEVLENSGNWKNNSYPTSRRDHTLVFDKLDDKIYLFGGWNPCEWNYTDKLFNEVWSLDSKWNWVTEEIYGTPPVARRGHSCVFSSLPCLSLIIFGGIYGYNKFLSDLFLLDLQNKVWTKIEAKGECPTARAWHSCSLVGIMMILFGGLLQSGEYSNEIFVLNLNSFVWEKIDPMNDELVPTPRCSHSAITSHESIIIFGGVTANPDARPKSPEIHPPRSFSSSDESMDAQDERNSDSSDMDEVALIEKEMNSQMRLPMDEIYILETSDTTLENYISLVNRQALSLSQRKDTFETSSSFSEEEKKELPGKRLAATEPFPLSVSCFEFDTLPTQFGEPISLPVLPPKLKRKPDLEYDRANLEVWNLLQFPDAGTNKNYANMKRLLATGKEKSRKSVKFEKLKLSFTPHKEKDPKKAYDLESSTETLLHLMKKPIARAKTHSQSMYQTPLSRFNNK